MSLYDLDRAQRQVGVGLAFQEVGKQRFASLYRIPVCGIEVAGVPGIGDVPFGTGEGQKFGNLAFRIAAQHPAHVADIGAVHADEVVVFAIIGGRKLDGAFPGTADAMFRKLGLGRRVDRIADAVPDFLRAGGGGGDVEVLGESFFCHQFFHDELAHGASANISMANKKYFNHFSITPYISCISSQMLEFAGFSDY